MPTFTIDKGTLLSALESVAGVAAKKAITPVLSCTRLRVKGGKLSAFATDMFIAAETSVPVGIGSDECEFGANASDLLTRTRLMNEGDLTIKVDGDRMQVSGKKSRKFELRTVRASDFPSISFEATDAPVKVEDGIIPHLVAGVAFAMSADEARTHLCAVYLHSNHGSLIAVATDGHRCAVRKTPFAGAFNAALIPAAAVRELAKMKGDLAVFPTTAGLAFQSEFTTLGFKLIADAYLPWETVMVTGPCEISVDRARLLSAVKACGVSAPRDGGQVVVDIRSDSIKLSAKSEDGGTFEDEVSASVKGRPVRVGMSAKYLADALAASDAETVALYAGGELDPISVKSEGLHVVVMPQRVLA